jgi:hypothetical protein
LVWSGDLPRPLQQVLFDATDGICTALGLHPLGCWCDNTGEPRDGPAGQPR